MKFNKIFIPVENAKEKGIREIDLRRLSNVVAFVGKNGSGKSRILDLIERHVFNLSASSILNSTVSHLPRELANIYPTLNRFKHIITVEGGQAGTLYDQQKKELAPLLIQLEQINGRVKQKYLRRIKHVDIQQLKFDPKQPSNDIFEHLITQKSNGKDELQSINQSALYFLSKLPHQLAADRMEALLNQTLFEDATSYKRFISLKKYIKDFLKKDLEWEAHKGTVALTQTESSVTYRGAWKLNGRPFTYTEFSDGERTLFAYALLFFLLDQNPNLDIKQSVIIIDEPELHLHPDSEIDLIDGLRSAIGENGQLILATHSINILSTLNYDEIFMVKDGDIQHPSYNSVSDSLSQLIGERVSKLSDFLSSISTWSYVNFMAQCFSNPEVIESARENDPQVEALKKAINERLTKSNAMLLDFGAGKGRLFEQIKQDYEFIAKVNYSALEIEESYHQKLTELGASQVYSSYSQLQENSFDFVLLCNVLHEIPLDEWQSNLNKVIKSLKPDGFLIIIEAKTLSKGEKIGKIGYLLLDVQELQKLFGTSGLPGEIISRDSNAITCAVFSKADLREITKDDIINCLVALETNTLTKVEELRNTYYDAAQLHHAGRSSAFWSQLHLNARFAQKHLQSLN